MVQKPLDIFQVELDKRFSFKMMDGELAWDLLLALDTAHTREVAHFAIGRVARSSLAVQGSGLHFCPGGNLRFVVRVS